MSKKAGWNFDEGDEIVPGRTALAKLGGGRRNEAWLAWDDHLMCIVVAKTIRPDQVDDKTSLRYLERESQIAARLNHPGIMRLFGAVLDGPRPHLVLEHVEGPTLKSLFRFGTLPLEQLLPLGADLAAALHYMAAEDIVHLDLKPSNIVMGAPARIIDLSLARNREDAAGLKKPVGTTDYMAPEQCDPGDRGAPGPASDVWDLGVTLFEAATGQLPFTEGEDEADELEARYPQLVEEPAEEALAKLPPRFSEMVLACLSKDASARPTAAEIAEEFQSLVSMLPRKRRLGNKRPRLS